MLSIVVDLVENKTGILYFFAAFHLDLKTILKQFNFSFATVDMKIFSLWWMICIWL